MFDYRYGVAGDGNIPAQESGAARENVSYEMHTPDDTAKHFGMSTSQVQEALAESRKALAAARSRRPQPLADDKVVTAWNGMMVAALAHASQVLNEPTYLTAAEATAGFLRSRLYDPQSKRLRRSYRDESATVDGFLDDYADLIHGLLDLYAADFDIAWLRWAVALEEKQGELFWDAQRDGYFDAPPGTRPFSRERVKPTMGLSLPPIQARP